MVKEILAVHNFDHDSIQHIKSGGDEHRFFVGDDFVLRIADGNINKMIAKIKRVQDLHSVPKIRFSGCSIAGTKYNYVLYSKIKGCDYIAALCGMSDDQHVDLGKPVSGAHALASQIGPVLLHNDLHPMNSMVENGVFPGIIDWECSPFGEPDFELCHFIHWCLYPPDPAVNLRPFLFYLIANMPELVNASISAPGRTYTSLNSS